MKNQLLHIPFVQKARAEGYDGRGVKVVRNETDLKDLIDVPLVVEDLVDIDTELAVIVARNPKGESTVYPAVEMVFHPNANLVEELISPARLSADLGFQAQKVALELIDKLEMMGLPAIEFFLTKDGQLLINEVAPSPHNSGHQTIEGNMTSQYEQLLRAILNLPLGNTAISLPAVMINLLGEPNHVGERYYKGLEEVLAMDNVHVHIYGKKVTKPFRKMGHFTILDEDIGKALEKAKIVRAILKVIT